MWMDRFPFRRFPARGLPKGATQLLERAGNSPSFRSIQEPSVPPHFSPVAAGSSRSMQLPATADGVVTYICRGGINLVMKSTKFGTIDIEADEAVIWRGPDREKGRLRAAQVARRSSTIPAFQWKCTWKAMSCSVRMKTRSPAGEISGPRGAPVVLRLSL